MIRGLLFLYKNPAFHNTENNTKARTWAFVFSTGYGDRFLRPVVGPVEGASLEPLTTEDQPNLSIPASLRRSQDRLKIATANLLPPFGWRRDTGQLLTICLNIHVQTARNQSKITRTKWHSSTRISARIVRPAFIKRWKKRKKQTNSNMPSKITEKQIPLLKRKLHWTWGLLTDEERTKIISLAETKQFSLMDASILIQDLFKITNDLEEKYERDAALAEIKKILASYTEKPYLTVTCSRCLKEVGAWYEEDNGYLICPSCRDNLLNKNYQTTL